MSLISMLKRSIRTTAAALIFIATLPPAHAAHQPNASPLLPDLPMRTTADHEDTKAAVAPSASMALTSRLPWLAWVGHRQPHLADVPQSEAVSAWQRRQRQFEQELDRRLIICRGC